MPHVAYEEDAAGHIGHTLFAFSCRWLSIKNETVLFCSVIMGAAQL